MTNHEIRAIISTAKGKQPKKERILIIMKFTMVYHRDSAKLLCAQTNDSRDTPEDLKNTLFYFVSSEEYDSIDYWLKFTVQCEMDFPEFRVVFADKALRKLVLKKQTEEEIYKMLFEQSKSKK